MRGSRQDHPNHRDEGNGPRRGWLSRTHDEISGQVVAGLLVAGIVLGATRLVGVSIDSQLIVEAIFFVAGMLIALLASALVARRRRPAADQPQPETNSAQHPPDASETHKLEAYVEFFAATSNQMQLGELDDVEQDILIKAVRLIEEKTGRRSVQLAACIPVESAHREAHWRLPYSAGISRSECRELEVALKDSDLAKVQKHWELGDRVLLFDLQAQRSRKAGADFEALAQGGFRTLACFPFGFATERGKVRPCIVLLSKESDPFDESDENCLILISVLLSIDSIIEQIRLGSERGEAPE
ncbi:MAG: hypothetical protein ACTHN3_07315 [Solirubrobacterales bacterium]